MLRHRRRLVVEMKIWSLLVVLYHSNQIKSIWQAVWPASVTRLLKFWIRYLAELRAFVYWKLQHRLRWSTPVGISVTVSLLLVTHLSLLQIASVIPLLKHPLPPLLWLSCHSLAFRPILMAHVSVSVLIVKIPLFKCLLPPLFYVTVWFSLSAGGTGGCDIKKK